jgi:hypothetical protein
VINHQRQSKTINARDSNRIWEISNGPVESIELQQIQTAPINSNEVWKSNAVSLNLPIIYNKSIPVFK